MRIIVLGFLTALMLFDTAFAGGLMPWQRPEPRQVSPSPKGPRRLPVQRSIRALPGGNTNPSLVECAALTYTGTESTLYFNLDPATGQPLNAGFTFVLRSGRVNTLSFAADEVPSLTIAPGAAGEIRIEALIESLSGFSQIAFQYEGNNFASRIGRVPFSAQRTEQLVDLFLQLSATGSFGHVSKDPNVDPRTLGGTIKGFTVWQMFNEVIDFKNIICMAI